MVDHVVRVGYVAQGLPLGSERIQAGSDTIFRCGDCGHQFALLNRVRRLRTFTDVIKMMFFGALLGLIPFFFVDAGRLGLVAMGVSTLAFALFGAAPMARDILLRRAHPPVRATPPA